jgi:hypothetical protein
MAFDPSSVRKDAARRGLLQKIALGALGLGATGVISAAILSVACDDPHLRSDGGQTTGGGDGGCTAAPGTLPQPNCDNSDHSCMSTPGCSITDPKCGNTSTCMPFSDNTGKSTLDFRLRRLNLVAPPTLATTFVQSTVVTSAIDLNAKECGELGKSTIPDSALFNWLLRVDKTNNQLITGGAPPPDNAFTQGFCFAQFTTADQIAIAPIKTGITFNGNTFKTNDKLKVNIPIFLTADVSSAVILPITDIVLSDVTISDDLNCIGTFNQEALDPMCFDDPSSCYKWNTAGALGGYITIKEADNVFIKDLNESLCAFLTGEKDPATSKCPQPLPQTGDYCSTSKMPGDCKDSFWLAATFAASAAKIFDGTGVQACSGATVSADAGTDSGGGTDSGSTDAGTD